jgi:tRNA pseudouridine13 synthase
MLSTVFQPLGDAQLKVQPEYFQVCEKLSFEPSGEGEHDYLYIQKTGLTTQQLAKQLSRFADIPLRDISWAGMKDKQAVTQQWFSVLRKPRQQYPWQELHTDQCRVLVSTRHGKKLRRGQIQNNEFIITLMHEGLSESKLEQRLSELRTQGFPNYFGPQRFGANEGNLQATRDWAQGKLKKPKRFEKNLYLSVARSWLFNLVLQKRVRQQTWDQLQPGDIAMMDFNRSVFAVEQMDDDLMERLRAGKIHPTGPLAGSKGMQAEGEIARLEESVFSTEPELMDLLARYDMQRDRRPLRVIPVALTLDYFDSHKFTLSFALRSGAYATSLIREIVSDS